MVDTILLQPVLAGTSSSIFPIYLTSQLTQSIHLRFGLPLLLLPGGTVCVVYLPTLYWSRLSACPNQHNLICLHLCDVLFIQILPDVTISLVDSWCLAYLHIVFSVPSIFFIWELAIGTVCIMHSIAGSTILLWIFALTCGGILLSLGNSKYSSSCFIHIVSSCSLMNLCYRCCTGCFSDIWIRWHVAAGKLHIDTSCWHSIHTCVPCLCSWHVHPSLPSTAPLPPPVRRSPFRTAPHHPVTSSAKVLPFVSESIMMANKKGLNADPLWRQTSTT